MNKIGRKKNQRQYTQDLLGVSEFTENGLLTDHGELAFFFIKPTNISVLSPEALNARVYALMTVLKGVAEIDMLCLTSRVNFDDNKRYLRSLLAEEGNPALRRLLEQDLNELDRIQAQTATSREFMVVARLPERGDPRDHLIPIAKSLDEQGFVAHLASKQDIQRMLAVYFEQNVTSEQFEDFDGERWTI